MLNNILDISQAIGCVLLNVVDVTAELHKNKKYLNHVVTYYIAIKYNVCIDECNITVACRFDPHAI